MKTQTLSKFVLIPATLALASGVFAQSNKNGFLGRKQTGAMSIAGPGVTVSPVLGSSWQRSGLNNPATASQFRANRSPKAGKKPSPKLKLPNAESVLLVYDYWSTWKYIGELYAKQTSDLLSHYGYNVDMVASQDYQAGMVDTHRATIYIGVLYGTDLPETFTNDVMSTTKPVCWAGHNIWKMAWSPDFSAYNAKFEEKFGMRFEYVDDGFNAVNYKSTALSKFDLTTDRMRVLDSKKTTVLAKAKNAQGQSIPYILKSGNFWYIADNPMSTVTYADQFGHDRTLAFCDILHDVLDDGAKEDHPALIRIEDVNATTDPASLRNIADILAEEGVPFVVSTIPVYTDPLGYWTGGVPVKMTLDEAPEVVDALHYMEKKGGQIIMHGVTHQYNEELNCSTGVSGSDWEFYRVVANKQGSYDLWGPVWEDSEGWVKERLALGKEVMKKCGFDPKGWLTPHYLASELDYKLFSQEFEYLLDPTINFVIDQDGYLFQQNLFVPFPIKDHNGIKRLPETVNFINPDLPNSDPEDLIFRARQLKVVRDGWAGMYFHPYIDPELMRTAVRGIKDQGYYFIEPSAKYAPK